MPRFTEERIRRLCGEAVSTENNDEFDRVIAELRSALEEHIRLARESLQSRAGVLSTKNSRKEKI
jgi:hypothetical protein